MIVLPFPPVYNKDLPKMLFKEFLVGERFGSVAKYAFTLLIILVIMFGTSLVLSHGPREYLYCLLQ